MADLGTHHEQNSLIYHHQHHHYDVIFILIMIILIIIILIMIILIIIVVMIMTLRSLALHCTLHWRGDGETDLSDIRSTLKHDTIITVVSRKALLIIFD